MHPSEEMIEGRQIQDHCSAFEKENRLYA